MRGADDVPPNEATGATTPVHAHAPERPMAGVAANAASFAVAAFGDAFAKLAVASMPIAQAIALRSLFLLIAFSPVLWLTARRGRPVIGTRHPWLHLFRALLHLVATIAGFTALRHLPLTTFTAIVFSAPVFMALIAIPVLGERIRPHQWVAIVLGLAGCFVIVRPRGDGEAIFMLLAMASTLTWALSIVLLRRLTRTESHVVILVWGNLPHLFLAGIVAVFGWQDMSGVALGFVLCLALMQLSGQWLSMTALRLANVATVAPVQYTQILWATFAGWLIFGEWPGPTIWVGAALIACGGFWLMRGGRQPS